MSSKDAAERVAWRERCGESCVARVMRRKLRGDSSGSVWAERRRRSLIEAHGWSFAITMGLRKTKQGGTLKALAMGTKRRTVRQRFQRLILCIGSLPRVQTTLGSD